MSTPTDKQIDIGDHPVAYRWLKETAKSDPEGFLRLVGPNRRRLTKLYGSPHWTAEAGKGWSDAWELQRNGLNWMILTGPDDTIYRLRVPSDGEDYLADPRVGVGIVSTLSDLLDHLTST